jgi:hypothetical protein
MRAHTGNGSGSSGGTMDETSGGHHSDG